MSRTRVTYSETIEGSPAVIFDLLADMPNYNAWLPRSKAFTEIKNVTPYPVQLGTSYLDTGSQGERPGTVTEFDRPRHLAFHHTMLVKRGPLRVELDVQIHYTIKESDARTHVTRDVDFAVRVPTVFKLADPIAVAQVRRENARLLPSLKRYVEAWSGGDSNP